MAPEIVGGQPAKAQADVFSLGMIFYELLTGHPPGNPFQPVSRLVADVPASVDAVIARALAQAPDDRWPTPTAFKEALQQTAGALPSTTQTYGASEPRRGDGTAGASVTVPVASAPAARPGQRPLPGAARMSNGASAVAQAAPRNEQGVAPSPLPTNAMNAMNGAAAPRPATQAPPEPVPSNPDDLVERWLIHKDKLDFGPFSMVQIRAQIERGDILAEHLMIDSDTGNKCRVKDLPDLAQLSKNAHRRLEQARRAQAEQRSEKSQKKKSVFTGIVLSVVVVAIAGAAGLFLLSRRDTSGGHLASREEEAEIDTFLKGVKIGLTKATVRRGAPGGHHPGGGNQSGGDAADFNNDANFGDVGKGFYQGDQTLDDDQIQNTMMANYRKLIPCIVHTPGLSNIALEFAVRGNGKVSAVKVNGQRTGALPACMLGRMQSFSFPKFNGSKTIASWSMSMGH